MKGKQQTKIQQQFQPRLYVRQKLVAQCVRNGWDRPRDLIVVYDVFSGRFAWIEVLNGMPIPSDLDRIPELPDVKIRLKEYEHLVYQAGVIKDRMPRSDHPTN